MIIIDIIVMAMITVFFFVAFFATRKALGMMQEIERLKQQHHEEMKHLFDALLAGELTERKDILKARDEIETHYLPDGTSYHVRKDV